MILCGALYGCESATTSFDETLPNIYRLTTQTIPESGGSITPSAGEFEEARNIEIEAIPAQGFIFAYWEGDLDGNENPVMLTFSADRDVTAHFIAREYPLSVVIFGEGTVHETLASGDSTANNTVAWKEPSGPQRSGSLTAGPTHNHKVGNTERFANPSIRGKIKQVYRESTQSDTLVRTIELTADPENGWFFDRWEGDLTGIDNPAIIRVDREKEVVAYFRKEEAVTYQIFVEEEGQGAVQLNPEQQDYDEGQKIAIRAVADEGWYFTGWEGSLSGQTNPETLTMDEDKTVKAVFEEIFDPMIEVLTQPVNTIAGTPISEAPRVSLTDTLGNPLQGAEVTVSLNKNSFGSGSTTILATNKDGIIRFSNLVIEQAAGDYVLIFETSEEGFPVVESRPFTISPASVDPSATEVTVSGTVTSEPNEILVVVNDRFGNKVSGVSDELYLRVRGANPSEPKASGLDQPGSYLAAYTPFNVGKDRIEIELGGEPIPGSPFSADVGIGELSSSLSAMYADSDEVVAGEKSMAVIEVRDSEGNLIGGIKDSFFEIRLTGEASAGAVRESGDAGVYQFDVENTVSEQVTLSASVNGVALDDQPAIQFEAADAEQIAVTTQPEDTETGQHIQGPPSVKVMDRYGNGVKGVEILAELKGGHDFVSGDVIQVTDSSGTAVFDNLVVNRLSGGFRLIFTSPGIDPVETELFRITFNGF